MAHRQGLGRRLNIQIRQGLALASEQLEHEQSLLGEWSQRHASRGMRGAVLLHASIIVDADPVVLTAAVARFYEQAGAPKHLDHASVTSLAECLPSPFAGDLHGAFGATLAQEMK